MAVSNAIGSNVFDICLGIGLPYLIKTGIVDPTMPIPYVPRRARARQCIADARS